jgi:hypothetical protein
MADIVQKGLNLQVEAEDLASETLVGLADQFDDLQARAESTFEAMAMAGADAASSLADSAGLFAPEWVSELEQLQQSTDATFADMGASAASGAAAMASSASTVEDAWAAATDALRTSSDTAIGSLDGLEGQMGAAADTAESTSDEISEAYSADALGLDAAAGTLEGLQGELESTAGVASSAAGEIADSWSAGALGLDSADGSLSTLQGQFDDTASVAVSAAGEIEGSWAGDALGLDAGNGSLKALQEQFGTTATDAADNAGKIGEAFSRDSLSLDAAKGDLGALDTQMATAAKDAQTAAGEITKAWGGVDLGAGAAGAAGATGAGAAGAGAGEGAGAAEGELAGISFSKLPTPSLSTLLTAGITTAIGLGASDLAMQQIESLQAFKALTGMNWTQTLTTSAAAKGVGLSSTQIEQMIQRLDTNIGKLTQNAVLGATAEGKAVGLGFGRQGVDPTTLKAVLNSLGGTGGASLAMKTLGLTPSSLSGMDAQQQLAVIAQKLDGIQNNTLKTAVTNELFGKGTDTAFLLKQFTEAESEAQKNLPAGLAKDLQMTLGGSDGKGMVDLQENQYYLEVEMSASLMKMAPDLDKLVQFAADHTKLLEEIALGVLTTAGVKKGAGLLSDIEKLGKGAGKVFGLGAGAETAAGGDIVTGATAAGATAIGLSGTALASLGAVGIYDAFGGGNETQLGTSGLDKLFSRGGSFYETMQSGRGAATRKISVDDLAQMLESAHGSGKGGTFTSADAEKAITEMAKTFGLNAKAMLADSYAEASLNPNALGPKVYNKKTGAYEGQAHGEFQFMPATWTADTKEFLGSSLPIADANNPFIAALVASAAMKKGGIGKSKNDQAATLDVVTNFENPGAKGVSSDMSRALPFLQTLDQDITSKTGPKIKQENDTLLLSLVQSAQKHGKDFSTATDTGLKQTETYLQQHKGTWTTLGTDLLKGLEQGLEKELPTLTGEAKKIAGQLESTLRTALQTHSPSEMTAAIGADLMQGLALGMERATPGVASVAGRQALLAAGPLATPTTPGGAGAAAGAAGGATIIIELDGRTLVNYVLQNMHQRTKLLTKFN